MYPGCAEVGQCQGRSAGRGRGKWEKGCRYEGMMTARMGNCSGWRWRWMAMVRGSRGTQVYGWGQDWPVLIATARRICKDEHARCALGGFRWLLVLTDAVPLVRLAGQ